MSSVLVAFIVIVLQTSPKTLQREAAKIDYWYQWHSITPNVQETLTPVEWKYKPKENRKLGKEQKEQ